MRFQSDHRFIVRDSHSPASVAQGKGGFKRKYRPVKELIGFQAARAGVGRVLMFKSLRVVICEGRNTIWRWKIFWNKGRFRSLVSLIQSGSLEPTKPINGIS